MNRRRFVQHCAAASALATVSLQAQQSKYQLATEAGRPATNVALPVDAWNLWIDEQANWESDTLHLPGTFDLASLPIHPPTGGWQALDQHRNGSNSAVVTLPATVEQHFWKRFGARPYTPDEYRYAADDPIPENGAYVGVSWWWREIEFPAAMSGQRILLDVRGARLRAEVLLNRARRHSAWPSSPQCDGW